MRTLSLVPISLVMTLAACTTNDTTTTGSAITAAIQTATTTSGGTLACAPDSAQVAACTGLAPSAACSLSDPRGTVAGTCRTSIDGSVGCEPNPRPPSAAEVAACASSTAGAACVIADSDADVDAGICTIARDNVTLACARVFTPPQAAIDACANLGSGAACKLTRHDGSTLAGTCGHGPDGATTVLACGPADRFPDPVAACASLSAGASCSMFAGHDHGGGTCTATTGGTVVCVLPCGRDHGTCDGGHHGGDHHGH